MDGGVDSFFLSRDVTLKRMSIAAFTFRLDVWKVDVRTRLTD